MTLGQSTFQDTFFVAGAQLTPFRQLRQIELELRQIDDSLKRSSINARRSQRKLEALRASNEPNADLDIEELEWDISQGEALIKDAEARKKNFEALKEELLQNVPKEYWDQGFEAHEPQHWVAHFSKKMALENLTSGRPSMQTIEQVMLLPEALQLQIAATGKTEFLRLGGQLPELTHEAEVKSGP